MRFQAIMPGRQRLRRLYIQISAKCSFFLLVAHNDVADVVISFFYIPRKSVVLPLIFRNRNR